MSSYVFDNAKYMLSTGQLNFVSGGPYRVALMTDDIQDVNTYSKKTKWSDVKDYEINSPTVSPQPEGYTSKELISLGIEKIDKNSDNSIDSVVYADDVNYNVSTISASYVVIVKAKTPGDVMTDDDELIVALDIRNNNNPIQSNAGVFKIVLNKSSGGFLIIQ